MSKDPRLTQRSLRILRLFLQSTNELAGSDVARGTGMLSGTLYPILMRLEGARWLKSKWEKLDPSELGRPRKRLYSFTPLGRRKAIEALAELTAAP